MHKERMWTPVARKSWPGAKNERTTGPADASRTPGRAAANLPSNTEAAALERATSRAEVLQWAASATAIPAGPSHAAIQPASKPSKVRQ